MQRICTIDSKELQRLIKRVKGAVSKDDGRPALRCIHLEFTPNELLGVACDGFIMATQKVAAVSGEPRSSADKVEFNLDCETLDAATKNLKAYLLDLEINENALRISSSALETWIEVPLGKVAYPNWRTLAPDTTRKIERLALDPDKLRKLTKGLGPQLVTGFQFAGPSLPVTVATKDGFWGMIMPCVSAPYDDGNAHFNTP